MTPAHKPMLRMLVALCACALLAPLPASAATRQAAVTPCWKTLLNEWYGGRIAHVYPTHCYRDAINHLPTDIQVYSSARDDIERALALAIAHEKNPKAPLPTITSSGSPAVSKGTTQKGISGAVTPVPGNQTPPGPIPSAIKNSSPGGATSFPLPLIILGGLALFLLAAGAVGLIVRRMQGRGPGTPGTP